jgi:hypothetical protein
MYGDSLTCESASLFSKLEVAGELWYSICSRYWFQAAFALDIMSNDSFFLNDLDTLEFDGLLGNLYASPRRESNTFCIIFGLLLRFNGDEDLENTFDFSLVFLFCSFVNDSCKFFVLDHSDSSNLFNLENSLLFILEVGVIF